MTKPTIGFIGVGYMGHGMAKNIAEYVPACLCLRPAVQEG